MNEIWYVAEDSYGFHTYIPHVFETKIEAEKYARMMFGAVFAHLANQ
jgi:hypothetical protein